jgi:hypothetical protein
MSSSAVPSAPAASATAPAAAKPIDTRAPRFVGGYTFVLAVAALLTALLGGIAPTVAGRALSAEFILVAVLWLSFAAGTFFGNAAHPAAWFFRVAIRPRLAPGRTEDPRPPRFALLIGFVLATAGLVLHLVGVPYGLAIAAAFIVIASFLQAFVGYCLGCQMYLLGVRAGLLGRGSKAAA